MSLARDALASGDPVLAENYLQHAEHYNRIIMAFRDQQMQQQPGEGMNGSYGRRPAPGEGMEADDLSDDEGDDFLGDGFGQPMRGQEPQPRQHDGQPRFGDRPPRHGHHEQPRHQRERYAEPPREGNTERERQPPASAEGTPSEPAHTPPPRGDGPRGDSPRGDGPPRRRERERFAASHEQPEFLRRPVRRPRREANGSDTPTANGAAEGDEAGNSDK
jgi:hypothetical protein